MPTTASSTSWRNRLSRRGARDPDRRRYRSRVETWFPQKELKMGTRDKLLSMTDGLRPKVPTPQSMGEAPPPTGNASSEARFPELTPGRPPARTGPGQMLQFRGEMMQSESRNQRLEERLKLFEGSEPSRSFDPAVIEPSKWANRHPDAFKSAAFLRFKDEIKASGGNVQ